MILTFGSINADLIVPVPILPRSGETMLGGSYELLGGGKGANQALAARRAAAKVMLVGAVGHDSFAAVALGSLRGEGIDTRLVRRLKLPTGCAMIMVSAAGESMIALAPGANTGARSEWISDELLDARPLLVAQLEVPIEETEALIRRVRRHGGRSLLNLAPAAHVAGDLLSDVDFLVANEHEAESLPFDPPDTARRLRSGLVITRGAAGG